MSFQKELALFKINCPQDRRTEVLQIAADVQGFVSEDLTANTLTLMVTGKSEKIDALREMLGPYGILEAIRTRQGADQPGRPPNKPELNPSRTRASSARAAGLMTLAPRTAK